MKKELLICIKPEHLINILNGNKSFELRKSVPKDYKGWVNIYCTKNGNPLLKVNNKYVLEKGCKLSYDLNGKVIGRFWFDEYTIIDLDYISSLDDGEEYDDLGRFNPFDDNMMNDYLAYWGLEYNDVLFNDYYAWYIKNLEIFDEPKKLSEFYKNDKTWSKHYNMWHKTDDTDLEKYVLTRPPQSYYFVYRL